MTTKGIISAPFHGAWQSIIQNGGKGKAPIKNERKHEVYFV
jgi:hypothetical protein